MKIKRILIGCFFALTFLACDEKAPQSDSVSNSNTDSGSVEIETEKALYDQKKLEQCIDSIWKSETISDLQEEIETLSKGERTLSCLTVDEDFAETEKIGLKFGEDNDMNFVTYHNFIVYPFKNWGIFYYDVIEDEEIEFGTWLAENEKNAA